MLTPEQEREYDELQELFALPAWKRLMEQSEKLIYHFQAAALEAKSWEEVCDLRGQAKQLAALVNYQDQVELEFANLAEEDEEPEA